MLCREEEIEEEREKRENQGEGRSNEWYEK